MGVNVVIPGGMGGGAIDIFNEKGIEVIVGSSGGAKEAAEPYLRGNFVSTGSACHEHQHHDECGGHWRGVCIMPENFSFGPLGTEDRQENFIEMTMDKYKTIRLIDPDGFTQEECANQMDVARSTVQGIYNSTRSKLVESLVKGNILRSAGGEYKLCTDMKIHAATIYAKDADTASQEIIKHQMFLNLIK